MKTHFIICLLKNHGDKTKEVISIFVENGPTYNDIIIIECLVYTGSLVFIGI